MIRVTIVSISGAESSLTMGILRGLQVSYDPIGRYEVGYEANTRGVSLYLVTCSGSRHLWQVPCDSEVEMPATELQTDQTVLHAAGKPEEVHEEEKEEEEEEVLPFGATTQPPMHEADAVRVPESLLEALTTPASELDLHTLDSTDAEAVLQQDELNQDLKRLNLAGIDALAYILMVKHGSLKRAFDWFDTHRKGKFSHVAWATGMILLRINLETLTGMKPSQVFNMMDGNPQNGFVSRKEWTRFFEALEEGRLAELLEKAAKEQGTIAERVKRRASKLEAERPPPEKPEKPKRGGRRPSAAIASNLVPPADNSAGDALAQEEELFRKRARQALNALGPGDALTFASDTFTKWQTDELSRQKVLSPAALQVPGLLLPEEKCDIVEAGLLWIPSAVCVCARKQHQACARRLPMRWACGSCPTRRSGNSVISLV